jgi:hypothetical protein
VRNAGGCCLVCSNKTVAFFSPWVAPLSNFCDVEYRGFEHGLD